MTLPFPAHAGRVVEVAAEPGRLATDAVNAAIRWASRGRGGTVRLLPGTHRCFSIRLASRVTLELAAGAVVEAADPARDGGSYDAPEPRRHVLYQDFGHSHWRNSLIWGDGIEEVAIIGPGLIDGARGLTRDGPGARWRRQSGERPLSMKGMTRAEIAALEPEHAAMIGLGNKAIGLRGAKRIHLSGFTIRDGGHFAVLASGCDDVTIRDLAIDTQRDGIDLDCVRDCVVERCRVNTPNDDAIVVKASLALGRGRSSERIVIRDCAVSGYDSGTLLDGTLGRTQQLAPDRDRVTGRIKLGTESSGDFRDIVIEDCRFERSRGLALEMVDGGAMENIVGRHLTMDEVTTAPLFARLGDRRRGPRGTRVGSMRGISISEVEARGIDPRFAASFVGLPGYPIRDLTLRDIRLDYVGPPAATAPANPPTLADAYPEPSMFGPTPAWGMWLRHVDGVTLDSIAVASAGADSRPPLLTRDVHHVSVQKIPLWTPS